MAQERSSSSSMTQRVTRLEDELLQLPRFSADLKRDMPHAYNCMMLSMQSVAVAFLSSPQLAPDAMSFMASCPRASQETLNSCLKFMRLVYNSSRVIVDTNWFALQSKAEGAAASCTERLAERLLQVKLQEIRGHLHDARVEQLYCVTFQTLNSLQNTQCPLLDQNRRLLTLCQKYSAEATAFIDAISCSPPLSVSKTIAALKKVTTSLLDVLVTCNPYETIGSSSKVLRVVPVHPSSIALLLPGDTRSAASSKAVFRSISDAVAAATPGCIILLTPGTYLESISLRLKGVVIACDCEHSGCTRCSCARVIAPSSPAVRVLAPGCRLQNLHLSTAAPASSTSESVSSAATSLIISHCVLCSCASAAAGCLSFIDCEFDNSCLHCIHLSSRAAAVVADCSLNCSLGCAVVVVDSSISFVRSSLDGVSSGVLAKRSHVSLVATSVSSTGPALRLNDFTVASLTASSIASATTGVVCECSCLIAYKSSVKGNLNSSCHASQSFLIFNDCLLSNADKLVSGGKTSSICAVDCYFLKSRLGIEAHSGASVFLSRCSVMNMKEHALSATGCSATFHQCRFSEVTCHVLNILGNAHVQTVDCFFDRCPSAALLAGLVPTQYETYLKFLWRWKRSSSKELHTAVALQVEVLPCLLVLGLDKPQHAVVYVMRGGSVECNMEFTRRELQAAADGTVLSPDDEEVVASELDRVKSNREKLLSRFVSMMGLNSLRLTFDKWSIAAAAAANERMLSEEAIEMAAVVEADTGSEYDDEEALGEAAENSVCAEDVELEGGVKTRVSKKQLRLELKQQLQQQQRRQTDFGHADSQRQFIYRVDVRTGMGFGAGTDANIYCTLGGENGLSGGEVHLADSLLHVNKFERGQVDAFEFRGKYLGRVQEVTIRTDGSGLGADWQLDHVTVTVFSSISLSKGKAVKFPPIVFNYGRWLNSEVTVVVLKPAEGGRERRDGSIISKLKL